MSKNQVAQVHPARYNDYRNRYFGNPAYRGNLQEYIRDGETDSIYPHPNLLEQLMGFPTGWTERSV